MSFGHLIFLYVIRMKQNQFDNFKHLLYRETIQSNAYELSETKSHASRMLHEQGEEITECSQSTSVLAQKMDNVLQELRRKVGISTQQVSTIIIHRLGQYPEW